ncbi:MAG: integrase core domain-containing protein [Chthoniobacteraceae bacterium]
MRRKLTAATLALALQRHSDRGVPGAATAFAFLAAANGVTLSMSRTANPYDHALAESFLATPKAECSPDSRPPAGAAAELMAFDDIESFDNSRRRHSSLGQHPPRDFEAQMSPTTITTEATNQQYTIPRSSLSKKDHDVDCGGEDVGSLLTQRSGA